ncbi:hypothetical protein CWB41_13905 [Methylovirgula ligni]|uniref:Uncharacterized protein n=1 Tax=Methylovirgula ligni TaxID=569860 RepID=A0A3D9YN12_9HYPH|nr:hypothetical protein [Methylovirgula ligni]QAY96688.1 hypothetical protein CWB41_13905 [Methylovirgula ligni]REF83271.1 hypothetical protein DES32_3187 [Methylovirgula ligni]
MTREKLPTRRPGLLRRLIFGGRPWDVQFGITWPRGRVAEIFISSTRSASDIEACARDGAILASRCLQHGDSIEEMAKSITREDDGKPTTIIGAALDLVASEAKKVAADFGLQGGGLGE